MDIHEIAQEMINPDGRGVSKQIISYRDKIWFVKDKGMAERKMDLLAYQLGKEWTNVAETIRVNDESLALIKEKDMFSPTKPANYDYLNDTWLVRAGQDYTIDDLKLKNLDEAVATELVFSIWIRRRDVHAFNRAYIEGIQLPVFFDHQTAFRGEADLADISTFCEHAGSWRIMERGTRILTTVSVRQSIGTSLVHFVHSIEAVREHLKQAIEYVQNNKRDFRTDITNAGFDGQNIDAVNTFLQNNCENIKEDAERVIKSLFQL